MTRRTVLTTTSLLTMVGLSGVAAGSLSHLVIGIDPKHLSVASARVLMGYW